MIHSDVLARGVHLMRRMAAIYEAAGVAIVNRSVTTDELVVLKHMCDKWDTLEMLVRTKRLTYEQLMKANKFFKFNAKVLSKLIRHRTGKPQRSLSKDW